MIFVASARSSNRRSIRRRPLARHSWSARATATLRSSPKYGKCSPGRATLSLLDRGLQLTGDTLRAGSVFANDFSIVDLIGRGGMGEVYRAHHTRLNRDVALKMLPKPFALDADRLARFKREAQVLASLNHPNIAAIYGFEESDDGRALVLELVEGPTLAERIERGPIPIGEAVPIARQIAEALEAAHEQGIVHRDLKPANVKLRPDGTVKVLDFGLAKITQPEVSGSPDVTGVAMAHAAYPYGLSWGPEGIVFVEPVHATLSDPDPRGCDHEGLR